MLLLHALEQRTCTLPDHGCRRQVIKHYNFWVVFAFYLKFLDCIIFGIFSHAHSTLCIISQAQRRCPVFWRRRFLEPKLVLIWRRPAVCCPSVMVSLVCTGWGTFRPKRWWNSPPVWRWVSKGSWLELSRSLDASRWSIFCLMHTLHRFWLWLALIVYYCSWRWIFWETGVRMLTSQVLTYCF